MAIRGESGFFYGELILDNLTPQGFPTEIDGVPVVSVFFSVEVGPLRFRYDGGNPTSTTGHPLVAGSTYSTDGPENVRNLKLIAQNSSPSPIIRYTLEKS